MNKHYFIIYILNRICKVWFTFGILYLPLVIFFLITKKDISLTKNSHLVNPYKNGILVPSKMTIQIPSDTMISYKSMNGNESGIFGLDKDRKDRDELADSILRDTTIEKKISYSKWIEFVKDNDDKSIVLTPTKTYSFDTTISIRSSEILKNILLYFYALLQIVVFIILPYFCIKVFSTVDSKNQFTISLSKNLYKIAYVILIWQAMSLIFSFIFSYWYLHLALETTYEGVKAPMFFSKVSFNPTLYFKFSYFFFALILMVLASIFKYGSNLEQDQELTI